MGRMCPLVGTMAELPYVPGHPLKARLALPSLVWELVKGFAFHLAFYPPNLRLR